MSQIDMITEMLHASFTKYNSIVSLVGGDKKTTQERFKFAREALEKNSGYVQEANDIVDSFLDLLRETLNVRPELSGALYKTVTTKLSTALKEERDLFIQGNDGKKLSMAEANTKVDMEELDKLKSSVLAMVTLLTTLDSEIPNFIPTRVNKEGKTVVALPRIPNTVRQINNVARSSGTRKISWVVDGTVYRGYSNAAMRKILGADTTAELVEAMGIDGKNYPDTLEFIFEGQKVTRTIETPLTSEEIEAVGADIDDNDDND